MKSLVADDDSTCRLVLEDVVSRLGTADSCTNGAEAVRAAREALDAGAPYDLICLDLLMPLMNGPEALRLIRTEEERHGRPRASRVIAITGSERTENVEGAFGTLCDAYVPKPVDMQTFLDVVERLWELE